MKTSNKILIAVSIVVAIFFIGFFVGRSQIVVRERTITKITKKLVPYKVTKTIDNPVPFAVHDTTYTDPVVITQMVDTAAILKDYKLVRVYPLDYSSDSLGVFKVDVTVNQNKIVKATSTVRPILTAIEKEKVIYKVPAIQFYGLIGSSIDFKTNQVQVGVDLSQKYMLGVSGIRFNDQMSYTINAGIKF